MRGSTSRSAKDIVRIVIDLRELHLFLSSQERLYAEGGVGKITISEGVLPMGPTRLRRYSRAQVFNAMSRMSSSLPRLYSCGSERRQRTLIRRPPQLGKSSPDNIERLFGRLGIFSCMSLLPELGPSKQTLRELNEKRNKVAHGRLRRRLKQPLARRGHGQNARPSDDLNSRTASSG
jgi:hypothetical protein